MQAKAFIFFASLPRRLALAQPSDIAPAGHRAAFRRRRRQLRRIVDRAEARLAERTLLPAAASGAARAAAPQRDGVTEELLRRAARVVRRLRRAGAGAESESLDALARDLRSAVRDVAAAAEGQVAPAAAAARSGDGTAAVKVGGPLSPFCLTLRSAALVPWIW